MDDDPQALAMATTLEGEAMSRDGSIATQASAAQDLEHSLAGVAALQASNSTSEPQQPRPVTIAPAMYPVAGTSPASTAPAPGGNLPTCQNCETHTTPLWRRDEMGAVLCNACGLFLKLHGRPRPISLKTDVIKSRNRVKTKPDPARQKKAQQHPNNLQQTGDLNGAGLGAVNGAAGARRASQKSGNGTMDDTKSPISRTGTPNLYAINPIYQNLDDQFQAQQLTGFGAPDGHAPAPSNGERLDIPQTHEQLTHEQLLATNASLKTRVSELEVIQELYRGRILQLEQDDRDWKVKDANWTETEEALRSQLNLLTEAQAQLQRELEESHRRENMLKRRLDEVEVEYNQLKEANEVLEREKGALERDESRPSKKARIDAAAPDLDEAASTLEPAS